MPVGVIYWPAGDLGVGLTLSRALKQTKIA